MSSPPSDFIPISQAANEYPTSRRTIERRRQAARDNADAATYQHFMIRTKDGHEFTAPSKDQVEQLTRDGRIPEWFVHRDWLDSQFVSDPRHDDEPGRQADEPDDRGVPGGGEPTHDKIISALLSQLNEKDAQLKRKDEQIQRINETMVKIGNAFQQSAITMHDLQQHLTALPSVIPGNANEAKRPQRPKPTRKRSTNRPISKTSTGGSKLTSAIKKPSEAAQRVVDTTPRPRKTPTKLKQTTNKPPAKTKKPTEKQPVTFAQRARRFLLRSK